MKMKNKKFFDAKSRTKNSLSKDKIDFDTVLFNPALNTDDADSIMKCITMRYKERTFDNYEYEEIVNNSKEIYDYQLCEDNKELIELWNDIENLMRQLTDINF
ncbi:hypothetical protein NUSPORA_00331 [Nucleospora cyclopteri]